MSTKNVWSEYQESSKRIAQNNADFIRVSGERIQHAISHGSRYMSDIVSDIGSATNSEGAYTTMSQQAQIAQPVMQKMFDASREQCDATLGMAEDATYVAEKNIIEMGRLANSMLEEQSAQMMPPNGDIWRASGKQTLSSWIDACTWLLQSSRQGIEALRSALAAPIPGAVPATVAAARPNSGKK